MNFSFLAGVTILGIVLGTLCMLAMGRRIGLRRLARDPEAAKASTGAIDGAVFGLLGLVIAFTFSGATSRFEARCLLMDKEANAISTAWLRLNLLPESAQAPLRDKLRQYLDARLDAFHKVPDMTAVRAELARAAALQNDIWTQSVAACNNSSSPSATVLLIPALNEMFDIASSRTALALRHPPLMTYEMMFILLLAGSALAGYALGLGKVRDWFHGLAFVLAMTLTVYVIVDFEYPRVGIIRIDRFEQPLLDLRQSLNP